MSLYEFKTSDSLTMGVELELQLVSLSDFNLTASSPDLLHYCVKSRLRPKCWGVWRPSNI